MAQPNTRRCPSCSHCQARWRKPLLPSTDAGQRPLGHYSHPHFTDREAEAEDHTIPKLRVSVCWLKPRPPGSESPNYSKAPAHLVWPQQPESGGLSVNRTTQHTWGPSPPCPSPRSASSLPPSGPRGGPPGQGPPLPAALLPGRTRPLLLAQLCQLQTCALTPLCGAQGGDVPAETARTSCAVP